MVTKPNYQTASVAHRLILVCGVTAVVVYLTIYYAILPRWSADLLPLWLAGEAFNNGDFHSIYPPVNSIFLLQPPDVWAEQARGIGYDGQLFPFLYPPLWAWIFGQVSQIAAFSSIVLIANVLNPLLLLFTCLLAHRTCDSTIGLAQYLFISMIILLWTFIGSVAIVQNQLHILVAFLIVLALERSQRGDSWTAGAALAVAASLKLFPAVFVLFWLFSGERRSVLSFALCGLALGLLSIFIAGWPIHEVFLKNVAAIGNTVFLSPISFSIDALVSYWAGADVAPVRIADTDINAAEPGYVLIGEKPPGMALFPKVVVVLLVSIFCVLMARATPAQRYSQLWPAILLLFPILGPLTWAYYFIPAVAFAPALLNHYGRDRGLRLLLIIFLPLQFDIFSRFVLMGVNVQLLAIFLLVGLAFTFLWPLMRLRKPVAT